MKGIEIIRLRALDQPRQAAVFDLLKQLSAEVSASDVTFTLYQHATIETDLSIHLAWHTDLAEHSKSALGMKLAYLFREFGTVDYSVWIENFSF